MKGISLSGQTISSILGKQYLLKDEIGKGGYGKVYSASNVNTGAIVAIKTLYFKSPQKPYFRQQYVSRFEHEISVGKLLRHPHIIQFLDHGYLENKEPFAVYEMVNGVTLNEHIIHHKTIAPTATQRLMLQLLDALIEIHNQGIIHCDLKPQNVMLFHEGEKISLKLFDFGGSIFAPVDVSKKNTNPSILTTAQYAAPEQLRGDLPTIKSDLYAWGLLLLECLTGKPVIQGASVAAVVKKQTSNEEITMPKGIFSKALKTLLAQVLHKDPYRRIENGMQLRSAFSEIDFSKMVIKPDAEITSILTSLDTDTAIH